MRTISAALIGLSLFLGGCQGKKPHSEHNDTIAVDQLPAKVKAAVKRESDTPVESVNRHELNGNVVYEAVVQSQGRTWDVELDEEGRLLRRSQRPRGQ